MFNWFKSTPKTPSAGEIIENYGLLLERYPLAVMDVSMLPVPKKDMKAVLKGLYLIEKDPERRSHLEVGYHLLSNFQEGVGPEPIDGRVDSATSSASSKEEICKVGEKLERWLPWSKLSVAEGEILRAEWQRFKEERQR